MLAMERKVKFFLGIIFALALVILALSVVCAHNYASREYIFKFLKITENWDEGAWKQIITDFRSLFIIIYFYDFLIWKYDRLGRIWFPDNFRAFSVF